LNEPQKVNFFKCWRTNFTSLVIPLSGRHRQLGLSSSLFRNQARLSGSHRTITSRYIPSTLFASLAI